MDDAILPLPGLPTGAVPLSERVPGSDRCAAWWPLSDSVFAIRDQSVSEAALFKATDAGWVAVGAMGKQFLIRDGCGLMTATWR